MRSYELLPHDADEVEWAGLLRLHFARDVQFQPYFQSDREGVLTKSIKQLRNLFEPLPDILIPFSKLELEEMSSKFGGVFSLV